MKTQRWRASVCVCLHPGLCNILINFEWDPNQISKTDVLVALRKYLNTCLQHVGYCHVPSLLFLRDRACSVFVELEAQWVGDKKGKCLIPQETFLQIFLKPSHKIRI